MNFPEMNSVNPGNGDEIGTNPLKEIKGRTSPDTGKDSVLDQYIFFIGSSMIDDTERNADKKL